MYHDSTNTGGVLHWPLLPPTERDLHAESQAWRTHAADVAKCYDTRLVNRRDVWGAYLPPERRTNGSTFTAPGKAYRGVWRLNAWRLTRHVRGESVGHVLGLHSTSTGDTSRWLAFDLDAHGPQGEAYRHRLTRAAGWLAAQLDHAGAVPLVEDSNGAGGYHVWIYFPDVSDRVKFPT